ncbi:MAG: 16S rRNA (guanine(527)-N(7))-methyltransferase RsmG [Dehalococcoidia bacterium]|nr:16S rRNA (guanine(527)-N(7))-methyltransferase RsmG [Dehalococcoidia bacterium]
MQDLVCGAFSLNIALSPVQLEQFKTYLDDLLDWNRRINLTAITDYRETQLKHFVDSLSVTKAFHKPLPYACRFIDVGAGGGFPGLPLKIAFPQIQLTLLEATNKKCDFLRHITQRLSLTGVDVLCARSEEAALMSEYREQFDIVLARGLAKMAALSELTLPFCKVGGMLIAQKKEPVADELKAAAQAVTLLGGQIAQVIPITLSELNDNRCLVIVEKITRTPSPYPRRNGVPAKNPLG